MKLGFYTLLASHCHSRIQESKLLYDGHQVGALLYVNLVPLSWKLVNVGIKKHVLPSKFLATDLFMIE